MRSSWRLRRLRRGELCGLSRDDVDLDAERLEVWWQITGISCGKARAAVRREETIRYRARIKTQTAKPRVVDFDWLTVDVLRAWRKSQIAERLARGRTRSNPEDLVFVREDGRPLDPDWVYKEFVRLVQRARHSPSRFGSAARPPHLTTSHA